MRQINGVVIHAAATRPEWWAGKSLAAKVAEVRRWHKARGWNREGYHFFIDRDGAVAPGRPVSMVGAHVKGHNADTIGICLFGGHGGAATDNFSDHFTSKQDAALRDLLARLKADYGPVWVKGHNEFASKACPCFRVSQWIKQAPPKITPKTEPKGNTMFQDYKNALASKTIWGGLIALMGVIANVMGYSITSADQAGIVEAVSAIVTAGGALLAIVGRVKATKAIG